VSTVYYVETEGKLSIRIPYNEDAVVPTGYTTLKLYPDHWISFEEMYTSVNPGDIVRHNYKPDTSDAWTVWINGNLVKDDGWEYSASFVELLP
jgi:hypothetical protein